MASRRKSSTGMDSSGKSNEVVLKQRVEELEAEVSRLKERLEQLRKAKSTTVLKREREIINVQTPGFRRDSKLTDTKQIELEGKLSESQARIDDLENEVKRMKETHKDEMFELSRKQLSEQSSKTGDNSCGHDKELQLLKNKLDELRSDKMALRFENEELVGRIQEMYNEMSLKEAEWCEKEEVYQKKLSVGWQEKYDQWMEATEKKMEELQSANAFLRTMIDKGKPKGRDPTGQDGD